MRQLVWEELDGAAYDKAEKVLGVNDGRFLYATKWGRKTVFCRSHGVCTLYVVGDDGWIYTDKWLRGSVPPTSVEDILPVIEAAHTGTPILSGYRYKP